MTPFEELDRRLLPGFERQTLTVDGNPVLALTGGIGPPLLMLHGDPQTHLCWHHIAPRLAARFTVILTDIRGRGETHKPAATTDSLAYSKRSMASEQLSVMRALGFSSFSLVAHDRGARVGRRLALDHPEAVERLAVMDVIPALDFYENTNAAIAQDYFYFFFLTQPRPLPELLIASDPKGFMRQILTGLSPGNVPYDDAALDLYLDAASMPEAIVAMCECFRAGFGVDREHDREDRRRGHKIICPTLVMWGEDGVVGRYFDVRRIWDGWSENAQYAPMPSGHFIPEEAPEAAFAALNAFL
jgi:haloacetate dehalogenase